MKDHLNRPFDKEVLAVLGIILVAFVAFVSFWLGGTTVSLKDNMMSANADTVKVGCTTIASGRVLYSVCPIGIAPLPPTPLAPGS